MGDIEKMGSNFFFDVVSKPIKELLDPIFSMLIFILVALDFGLAALR